jgi:hypothetical protein
LNMANASSGTLAVARGGTGASTFTAGQVLIGNTTSALLQTANLTWDVANNRLGVLTATPATSLHVVGEIVATNNITSYYSDDRLKTKIADIHEPLKIINNLNGLHRYKNCLDFCVFNNICYIFFRCKLYRNRYNCYRIRAAS